jgi:co-chaperonin GroES (HSP10)
MQPLRDRIFVRQDPERQYLGGIIVPTGKNNIESQAQLGRYGTVIAAGPDVDGDQLKAGDRICYGEFDYPKTPDGLVILSDADVCGVIDEQPAAT